MRISVKARHLPPRIATGAFILNSGIGKLSADDATAAQLHGFSDLSWIVTAYLLTSTATVPLYGKLSDLYGRRLLFVVAISIFLVGSCLCAVATSMTELTAFGKGGHYPGEWYSLHNIATDSKGNLYTVETYEGRRLQRFLYKGLAPVRSRRQGVAWPNSQ